MGFDWFRVDADMVDHPKVLALAAALGDQNAGWYFIRLMAWTKRYAPKGRFPAAVTVHLEAFLGWRGDRGVLIESMRQAGLLDCSAGAFEVHGWDERQSALVEKASKDAARQRKKRRLLSRGQSTDGHADVTRDGAGTGRDGTDVTGQDDLSPTPFVEPAAAPSPEKPGEEFEVWNRWQDIRGEHALPKEGAMPEGFGYWYAKTSDHWGPVALEEAFCLYCGDPWSTAEGLEGKNRDGSVRLFMSDQVNLERLLEAEKRRAHG